MNIHKSIMLLAYLLASFLLLSCDKGDVAQTTVAEQEKTVESSMAEFNDEQVRNIVRRSYQYVALYNVINKFAMDPRTPGVAGWNTCVAHTMLLDHTMGAIARPNNDSLYIGCMLDLRKDPVILDFPAFDSKYVSLMTGAYDHYINVPLTMRNGDFAKPEKVLLYSARTEAYNGEPVDGVDHVFEMTGDFLNATFRVMPHSNEPERFKKVIGQMQSVKLMTLGEYKGGEAKAINDVDFPPYG